MTLILTEDELVLQQSVRDFFAVVSSEQAVRRVVDGQADGFDPAVWKRIASELALPSLGVPEEFGGQGFGMSALAIVAEEAGRATLTAPLLGTAVLAVRALLASPESGVRTELLGGIAAGEIVATVALDTNAAPGGAGAPRANILATGTGPEVTLVGRRLFLTDATAAGVVLVPCLDVDGADLLAVVRTGAAGVTLTPMESLDLTRPLSELTLAGTSAYVLARGADAGAAVDHAHLSGLVAVAAAAVGGARMALESAVSYSLTRQQFGREIGSFQALKHRCADLLVRVEGSWSLARHAAQSAEEDTSSLACGIAVRTAAAHCLETYQQAAAENIQIHGGIGFTWEHSAHIHLRRATADAALWGHPSALKDRVVDGLLAQVH